MALTLPFKRKEPTIDDHAEQVDNNLRLAMRNADELEPTDPGLEARKAWDRILSGDFAHHHTEATTNRLRKSESTASLMEEKIDLMQRALAGIRKCIQADRESLAIMGVDYPARVEAAVEAVKSAVAEDLRQQAAE